MNTRPSIDEPATSAPAAAPIPVRALERDDQKTAAPAGPSRSLKPISSDRFGYPQARHLLWRAGFGGTDQQVRLLMNWGPEKAVDHLLDIGATKASKSAWASADAKYDKDIMRPASPEEREAYRRAQRSQDEDTLAKFRLERQRREQDDRQQMADIQKWWLRRMIETPKPLEEKLTLFWHGHFATNYRTIENSYHMLAQNELFRSVGTDNFGDLLRAIIRDPAMIAYLDNNDSKKNKPNENLAREIMELFSLGVGNYTENDIKEGARALTGYTFEDDSFVFEQKNHDATEKSILGSKGNFNGEDFVRIILSKRACAEYITRRLYNFFVADVPPDERGGWNDVHPSSKAVMKELAQSFHGNYELKPLLRKLFLSEHFYDDRFLHQQIKSPVMLVVGAIRSLNAPPRDLSILADALDLMGQRVFMPPSVKGWDGGRSWINTSTMFVRQNTLSFLLTGKKPQGYDSSADTQVFDGMTMLDGEGTARIAPTDVEGVTDRVLMITLGQLPKAGRDSVLAYFKSKGDAVTNETITRATLLATCMPEYQLC